jgi:hypothetical protein
LVRPWNREKQERQWMLLLHKLRLSLVTNYY